MILKMTSFHTLKPGLDIGFTLSTSDRFLFQKGLLLTHDSDLLTYSALIFFWTWSSHHMLFQSCPVFLGTL